jgi:hypothetical protein
MSTVTSAVTTCPQLQASLNESFLVCNHYGVDPITLLPFLYSPENRTGLDFKVSPVAGKKRTLLMVYGQVIDDSEVDTKETCDKTCTATTERGDLSAEYTIDCGGYIIESLIDPVAWIDSCTDNRLWANDQILKMVAAMDNKISKGVVTDLGGLVGNYASDVTVTGDALIVNTLLASSVNLNPLAWYDIDFAQQATYCADAFIASGQTLYKYARIMEAGCCASTGINLGEMMRLFGRAVTYDAHVQETYGTNMAFMLQRGAIQLLTLNMNGGQLTEMSQINVGPGAGTYYEGIINSPFTGLPMDLTIKYDCGKLHIILEANVVPVGMPLDMFPVGNRNEGVTYANWIQVVNT